MASPVRIKANSPICARLAAIVSAVIGMGQGLRLRVIAEGVETPQQVAFLLARQCTEGQGYLFNPPLAAADFARLLGGAP